MQAAPLINRRQPIVTYVLAGLNAAVFLIESAMGLLGYPDIFFAWGAKINVYIALGQWWRMITCMFLHGSLQHGAMNLFALVIWGRQVEALLGRARFAAMYFAAGIMGSAASFAFTDAFSVGASGAIFGLFGALLIFRSKYRSLFQAVFGAQVLFILGINLVMGFTSSGIDNFGHLGGLLGGYLATAALGFYRERGVTAMKILAALGWLAAFAALCYVGLSRYYR